MRQHPGHSSLNIFVAIQRSLEARITRLEESYERYYLIFTPSRKIFLRTREKDILILSGRRYIVFEVSFFSGFRWPFDVA